MGLYDNWKLSNSTAIPQFEGSAGEDFIRVGQYKQGLYDTNSQAGMALDDQAGNVSSIFKQDQGHVDDLRNETQSKLKSIANRGDWENALPEVQQIGRNFANRSRELMAPQQQFQEYKESLNNKDLNLTPEQKSGLTVQSLSGYQGLQKDVRGRYVGGFSGVVPAKNIDVNKKVDEWMKDAVSHKWGNEAEALSSDDGGMWIVKNGVKIDRMTKDQVQSIVSHAAANDTEYTAYKNMQAGIKGHQARQVYDIDSISNPATKARVWELVHNKGLNVGQAYQAVTHTDTNDSIDNNALSYALNKYVKNDRFTEMGMKDNPYELQNQKHRMDTQPITPFITQGPDSKLTDDEKDYTKLNKNVTDTKSQLSDVSSSISAIDRKLGGKPTAAVRTQLESERNALVAKQQGLQQQSNRGAEIMDYSKDLTAQHMGYDDYDTFLKRNSGVLRTNIQKVFPSGFTSSTGRKVSIDDLIDAAADNRIKPIESAVIGPGGRPQQMGSTITLKDGSTIKLSNGQKGSQLWDQVGTALQGDDKINEFNTKLTQTHAENVKDFAVQGSNISLNEGDRKDITAHIKGNMDGVRFSNPGQLDTVKPPTNFEVYTISTNGLGNDAKVRVQELDDSNKPTGKFYDVTMSNSNVGEVISRKLAESDAPESKLAADVLSPNSGARQLFSTIPGNKIHVGKIQVSGSDDADPVDASIKVTRNRDKTISYNLINDESGEVLKSTGSAATAGAWMDNVQGKDTYSNGRRKSPYDAKSRRTK